MTTKEELANKLPAHVGGLLLAAADLIEILDRENANIEFVRGSMPAKLFREQFNDFKFWLLAAGAALPPTVVTEEQRRSLDLRLIGNRCPHDDQARI